MACSACGGKSRRTLRDRMPASSGSTAKQSSNQSGTDRQAAGRGVLSRMRFTGRG